MYIKTYNVSHVFRKESSYMTLKIEIFPTTSTCPAVCGHCELKYKKTGQTNTLDRNVEQTFNDLLDLFNYHNLPRTLNYAFPLQGNITDPLPNIKNKDLLRSISMSYGKLDTPIDTKAIVQKT